MVCPFSSYLPLPSPKEMLVECQANKDNDLNSYHLAILYSLCSPLLARVAYYRSTFGRADIPVIVVGHTGCGGAIASFAQPPPTASDADPSAKPDTHLMQFLDPLIRFRHTLPEGSDVNDLIRENIKDGVGNLVVSPVSVFFFHSHVPCVSAFGQV